MMRALFSGVTGLRSHQTKMDVIGNNISNVNTLGFKKSAANFADLYSETTAAATAPSGNKGGTNANQIGLGVSCNAIVVKHTPGAASYTGNTLDLAISGDGYFTVRVGEEGNVRYTRAGNFGVSSNGSLVTSAGYFVQCFNSMYREGDVGTVSSMSGLTDASATGFNSFTFTPVDAAVVNAASGTYSFAINENNQVDIYRNGVVVDTVDVMDANGNRLSASGFQPNATYTIDVSGLGTIQFKTDGHSISAAGLNDKNYENMLGCNFDNTRVNTTYGDADNLVSFPNGPAGFANYAPAGTYTIDDQGQIVLKNPELSIFDKNEDGSYISSTGTPITPDALADTDEIVCTVGNGLYRLVGTVADGKVVSARVEVFTPANADNLPTINNTTGKYDTAGREAEFTSASIIVDEDGKQVDNTTLQQGEKYTIRTPLGDITFTAKEPIANASAATQLKLLADNVSFTGKIPSTEGSDGTAYSTGLTYLNSLLQSASFTISNNDGFFSGTTRGDMVINPDLFENVMVTEDGSVVAQLKRGVTADELRGMGIVNAQKMAAGERVVLGYVAMANFSNPEGLEKIGTNLYQATTNSGQAMYSIAGENGVGALATSSLEMSNVDLSEEMVNMITTQRGFQANSRIITVTDTMLEELINLKR